MAKKLVYGILVAVLAMALVLPMAAPVGAGVLLPTLGDFVWEDLNEDGIQDFNNSTKRTVTDQYL